MEEANKRFVNSELRLQNSVREFVMQRGSIRFVFGTIYKINRKEETGEEKSEGKDKEEATRLPRKIKKPIKAMLTKEMGEMGEEEGDIVIMEGLKKLKLT